MFSACFIPFRSRLVVVFVFLSLVLPCAAQMPELPPRSSTPPSATPQNENPSAPGAQNQGNSQTPQEDRQTGSQQPISPEPGGDQNSMFVFKKQVEEVVLHATVLDEQRRPVPNLDKRAFTVFENGIPQTITSFRHEDVPVAMGIVIDNSGSMRDKREKINQAVLNLIRASNSQDQIFVVNFSQNYYLDQDYTSDVNLLQAALHQVTTKGSTALYDAIVASSTHLRNNPKLDKKVLLVITDGQDNMSQETLQEAMRSLQKVNGPTIYAIGLLGSGMQSSGREALQQLADATGGVAYFPEGLDQVNSITRAVAHDIRSQYIVAYKPQNQNARPSYQSIRVEARAPGTGHLTVRTQSGYFENEKSR